MSHSLESLWFSIIRSSCWCVYFIIPLMGSFEQYVSLTFSWTVIVLLCSSCLCKYFILLRMDSFEQKVSISFSWIVMFSIIRSSCWCVYIHTSPDGFFWAVGEYTILLDRYVFDYSQQLLMCIFHHSPMGSFEQLVSFPFSWIVMFSIIRSSCWCVYFIIPWMDSFEQQVSVPFSLIVMIFDYLQQLLI